MSAAREKAGDPTTQVAPLREVKELTLARRWEKLACEALLRPDVALAVFEHEGRVNSAAFSPDGAQVVAASHDKTARVWRWSSWSSPSEMLWSATSYCLPVQKRMTLLGETEEEATEACGKARAEVAARGV